MHVILNIFLPLLVSTMILLAVYVWGRIILERFRLNNDNLIFQTPLSILLGYGALVVLSLLLAAFGPINKMVLGFIFFLTLFLGRNYAADGLIKIKVFLNSIAKRTPVEKLFLATILFFFLFYLSSALVPPYRGDALAYHLPEAMGVAKNGLGFLIKETVGNFYKNIPAGIEVMDALLYISGGFTAINLAHYATLLSGLLFVYIYIKSRLGRTKAMFFYLLSFSVYELFVSGTNPYIDAVMTAWEITGLFLLLLWYESSERKLLILSGIFYGLALSTKYNSLYGLILAFIIIIFSLIRARSNLKLIANNVVTFGLSVLLVGGFWYIKNLVLYGNPVYPFYFGHVGFSDEGYSAMVAVIKSFVVERNFLNFLLIPFLFFFNSYYFVMFFAFISWPFAFFIRNLDKQKKYIINLLSFYVFVYTIVWFFLATHQLKFFFVPMICLLVIFAILTDVLRIELGRILDARIMYLSLLILVLVFGYEIITAKNNYFLSVKKTELTYVIGMDSMGDFYKRRDMGHIYEASQYINDNFSHTTFLEVWSTTKFFLSQDNRFFYPGDLIYDGEDNLTTSTILSYLDLKDVNYVILDKVGRDRSRNDPILSKVCDQFDKCDYYFNKDKELEKFVEDFGRIIYQKDGVEVYDLRRDK